MSNTLAIFLPSLRGGGAERVMLLLAQGFAEQGISVDMVLAKAEGPYLKQVPDTVRVVDLNASRVLTSLPGLVRYLRRERPSAVLSALDHANIIAIIARRIARISARVVVSVHSTISISSKESGTTWGRLMPLFMRWHYPSADTIVAISRSVADDLAPLIRIPKEEIHVIYNPVVSPELFVRVGQPVTHPWFLSKAFPIVIAVGRLTKAKDFPTLLRAFALVKSHCDAKLVILGEGEERGRLEEMIKSLNLQDDVDMPGFVDNPYAYMKRANLFVLSSQWEGLGMVLIEAMACGTPVVATDCLSGPREILEDGKWGKLVPVGDSKALAEAILDTLRNPSDTDPSVRARDFSVERAVREYANVLGLSLGCKQV